MDSKEQRLAAELKALEEEKKLSGIGGYFVCSGTKARPASVVIDEYIMKELRQHHPELSGIDTADQLKQAYPDVYQNMKSLAIPKIWDRVGVVEGLRETLQEVDAEKQATENVREYPSFGRYMRHRRGRHGR